MKTTRVPAVTRTVVTSVACLAMVLLGATSQRADAHPLGNFTINHLSELSFGAHRVDVHYVLDMAEIPTFQTMRAESADGKMTPAQLAAWARSEGAALVGQLDIEAGGARLPLVLDGASAHTRPGAGGLPTLYLTARYHGALASNAKSLHFADATFPGRLGWHDVVVRPATEPTHELTAYPNAMLGSPREVTAVSMSRDAAGIVTAHADAPAPSAVAAAAPAFRSNQLSDMLARGTGDWTFVLWTLMAAIALGALHALEPGHGKTLLAVSLVGARATFTQAGILAGSLTVAHTIGVLALGLAIELFKGYFVPEAIYPWITLLSGIAIAVLGARAVERQLRLRRPFAHVHVHAHALVHPHEHEHEHHPVLVAQGHAHDGHTHAGHTHPTHTHDGHTHDGHAHAGHTHHHDLDDEAHARAHAIPGTAPLRFAPTVWAAMSGGVAPCPAALVVLLAAIALNQVTYGLVVIVAFSFGLAATLTGLGIAVVRGASWLRDRPAFDGIATWGPLVSASIIATIGAVMVGQAFALQGFAASPLLVTALAGLAIAGYAFSHPFAHRHEAHA